MQVTLVPNRTTHQVDVKLKQKTTLGSSPKGALGLAKKMHQRAGLAKLFVKAKISTVLLRVWQVALEGELTASMRQVFGGPAVVTSFLGRLLGVRLRQQQQQNTVLGA